MTVWMTAGLVFRCQQVPGGAPGGASGLVGSGPRRGACSTQAPSPRLKQSERRATKGAYGLVMPCDARSLLRSMRPPPGPPIGGRLDQIRCGRKGRFADVLLLESQKIEHRGDVLNPVCNHMGHGMCMLQPSRGAHRAPEKEGWAKALVCLTPGDDVHGAGFILGPDKNHPLAIPGRRRRITNSAWVAPAFWGGISRCSAVRQASGCFLGEGSLRQ